MGSLNALVLGVALLLVAGVFDANGLPCTPGEVLWSRDGSLVGVSGSVGVTTLPSQGISEVREGVNLLTGAVLWTQSPVTGITVISGLLYSTTSGRRKSTISAYNVSTGQLAWSTDLPGSTSTRFIQTDAENLPFVLLVDVGLSEIRALRKTDGEILWLRDEFRALSVSLATNRLIIAVEQNFFFLEDRVSARSARTGRVLWRKTFLEDTFAQYLYRGNIAIVASTKALIRFNPRTGDEIWRRTRDLTFRGLSFRAILAQTPRKALWISIATGSIIRSASFERPSKVSFIAGSKAFDVAVVLGDNTPSKSIRRLNGQTGATLFTIETGNESPVLVDNMRQGYLWYGRQITRLSRRGRVIWSFTIDNDQFECSIFGEDPDQIFFRCATVLGSLSRASGAVIWMIDLKELDLNDAPEFNRFAFNPLSVVDNVFALRLRSRSGFFTAAVQASCPEDSL